jgi:hypothetical protein
LHVRAGSLSPGYDSSAYYYAAIGDQTILPSLCVSVGTFEMLDNLFNAIKNNLKANTSTSWIGASITALTIFSHLETFVNFSRFVRRITQHWREIIAYPWKLLLGLFNLEISTTLAGMFTVLIAVALVTRSSRVFIDLDWSRSDRAFGLLASAVVGTLYTLFIVVPTFGNASGDVLSRAGFTIEFLHSFFYRNGEGLGWKPTPNLLAAVIAGLVFAYCIMLFFAYLGRKSSISKWRTAAGLVFLGIFLVVMTNFLIFKVSFVNLMADPSSLAQALWEYTYLVVENIAFAFSPVLAMVYLSNPKLISRRNYLILGIIGTLLALDRLAVFAEYIFI